MARTALAMMLSFVLIMFATPQALAKTNSKQVAKKAAVAKAPAAKRPAASAKQPAKQAAKKT
ncbi:MAG: hypothetical protein EOO79_09975, partial [Oxalobacteraceae bacterium]